MSKASEKAAAEAAAKKKAEEEEGEADKAPEVATPTQPENTAAETLAAPEAPKEDKGSEKESTTPEEKPEAPKAAPVVSNTAKRAAVNQIAKAPIAVPKAPTQYFQKKVIINIKNKVVNGKLFKEVRLIDHSTYLLNEAEFTQKVTTE